MKNVFAVLCAIVFSATVFAQEKSPWSHESEASIVKVDGNSSSDSYSAKQKTGYQFDLNILTATARYLKSESSNVETARQWEASVRYERELSAQWAIFLQHGAESDSYAGYLQRDNTDLGGKYYFTKAELEKFFVEAGFRYQKTQSSSGDNTYSNMGRVYTEYSSQFNSSVSGKLWVEYIPNFSDNKAYLINGEPSLSVMMNQIFSLKVAYLVKYHNKILTPSEKRQDTTFTTALVAKF